MASNQKTSYTLLKRALDASDEEAWEQLVEHYRRFIFYVLNELQVAPTDTDDLSQQVLVALLRDLPNYDRSKARFRTWLSVIIRNAAVTHFRQQQSHQKRLDGLRRQAVMENGQHHCDVDAYIEKEWTTYIATQAMQRVRAIFEGKAIEAFELGLDGLPASDIAEKVQLTVSSVYTLRKRVKNRLCLEILDLTSELEP